MHIETSANARGSRAAPWHQRCLASGRMGDPKDPATIPMVRWTFERNGNAITCEIDMNDGQTCDVALIPHWDAAASVIERFDGPMRAIERHAELAVALLDQGWTVTDRV